MAQFATVLTRVTLDANRTITTGTIRVLGILVSNSTASDVEVVFTNDAGTPILNITVPAHDSEPFNPHWIADAGLSILSLSDVNVVVTVAHGADGS